MRQQINELKEKLIVVIGEANLDSSNLGERSSTYEIESLILGAKDLMNVEIIIVAANNDSSKTENKDSEKYKLIEELKEKLKFGNKNILILIINIDNY